MLPESSRHSCCLAIGSPLSYEGWPASAEIYNPRLSLSYEGWPATTEISLDQTSNEEYLSAMTAHNYRLLPSNSAITNAGRGRACAGNNRDS